MFLILLLHHYFLYSSVKDFQKQIKCFYIKNLNPIHTNCSESRIFNFKFLFQSSNFTVDSWGFHDKIYRIEFFPYHSLLSFLPSSYGKHNHIDIVCIVAVIFNVKIVTVIIVIVVVIIIIVIIIIDICYNISCNTACC